MIVPYASRTGTKRNLDALRDAGWHLLVSATGRLNHEGFPFGLDNGAWTAFQQGGGFDERAFWKALVKFGKLAEWVVVPDIVAAGLASLEFSLEWMERVQDQTDLVLLPVQDGMTTEDVRDLLGPRVGIFVGGSTEWKEATLGAWATLARERGVWCHVARVNSIRRINLCQAAGVTSFDGTSASRFAKSLPRLDAARRQIVIADSTPPRAPRARRVPAARKPAPDVQLALI